MKKLYILIASVAALALCACSKENSETPAPETGKVSLNVRFDVTAPEPATKAVKAGWESGDKIYCWFDSHISQTPDMTLTYGESGWEASDVDADIVAGLQSEGRLKFIWIGSNDLESWTYDGSDARFYLAANKGFPRMLAPSTTSSDNVYQYDAATKTLSASLKWSYATNVQIVMTGATIEDGYQISCPGGILNTMSDNWRIVSNDFYIFNRPDEYAYGVANEDGVAFNMFLKSGGGNSFTFSLRTQGGKVYTYTVNKSIVPSGKPENNFFAFKLNKDKFFDINGHTYVDMGDGLKWATMNVGATKPEEYGGYFAWGETDTKTQYDWPSYAWSWDNDGDILTKYSEGDGKTILDPEDDAASKNWGSTWRTPTSDEWEYLLANTNQVKTDNYNGTGIAGWIFTSKVSGYEGNSIFLPFAGYWGYETYHSYYPDHDFGAYYWSSSLDDNKKYAKYLPFNGVPDSEVEVSSEERFLGFSVRPVSD